MGLPNAYLITTKNLDSIFNAILTAQAPDKFNAKFLSDLDFSSSNDRLYIGVLKDLKFIDDGGVPTQRYYDFLDQSQSGAVLAEAIKEAYSDLFQVNKEANKLSIEDIKNKLKTLTQGKKSDKVLGLMANTFNALCQKAEWSKSHKKAPVNQADEKPKPDNSTKIDELNQEGLPKKDFSLNYNIQIHLPETRDVAVYDAIFTSLRKHL